MDRRHFLIVSLGLAAVTAAPALAAEAPAASLTLDGARAALAAGAPVEMQRRGGGFRGGGGGFRGGGGGFRGGFRGGPRFYGGGFRGGYRWGGPRFYGGGYARPYYGYGWGPSYGYPYGGYRRCWVNRWGEWVCRRPYYSAPVVPFPFPFFW